MAAYLIDHPPKVPQWYAKRNRPLTGCTVIHTAESVMDTVGPDTGAEAVARFIQGRTTPGSYHGLVDSDSRLRLVPLECGAFHDATGSNNWALSLSFACATSDWRRMTPAQRSGFLRNGALEFAEQQKWREANGHPLTELRLITKAQSDRGESGFIYHGLRDPGRRSDPGVAAPDLFPLDEFLDHCRAALAGTAPQQQEDDMPYTPEQIKRLMWEVVTQPDVLDKIAEQVHRRPIVDKRGGWGLADRVAGTDANTVQTNATLGAVRTELLTAVRSGQLDEQQVAQALAPAVIAGLAPALADADGQVDEATVLGALRTFFAAAADSPAA